KSGGGPHLGRGQLRRISARIAAEKIEDIMFRRIHSGGECGPCHRRNRREGSAETAVRSTIAQPRQVRQSALGHQLLGDDWIEAVESKEDGLAEQRSRAPGEQRPSQAKGPDGGRRDAGEDGEGERKERTEKRESGAGADISEGSAMRHRRRPSTKGTSKTFSC